MDRSLRRQLLLVHAVVILLAVAIARSKWSFTGVMADAFVLSLAWFAYADLAFALSLLRPKAAGWALACIASLPLLAGLLVGISPFMVVVMFALHDMTPRKQAHLDRNYSYRITWYGAAFTSEGSEVRVFYHPTLAPFLEKEIFLKQVPTDDIHLERKKDVIIVHCPTEAENGTEDVNVALR